MTHCTRLVIAPLMLTLGVAATASATYQIPADRRIPWSAGLDPVGGIPVYAVKRNAVTDHGADSTGGTNATSAIQACLNAVVKPGACFLPAGTYRVDGTINMPAQVALRGAGPGSTTLNMGPSATIAFIGGAKGNMGSVIGITGGYTKGSTTLTLSGTSGLAVNDWIAIFQNNDTSLIDVGDCDWCGDDTGNGGRNMMQFARITAISGSTVSISRPMYFNFSASLSPGVREMPFNSVFMAGVEDLRLNRTSAPNSSFITGEFSRHCWVRNVETNKGGDDTGEQHVRLEFSHGWEIRDSYIHHGFGYDSGSNYGIHIIFWNSDHKIENNIIYSTRHGVNFEGGGNGSVVLYNYFEAHYEGEEPPYLDADLNPNHGAHPAWVLMEGNSSQKITWDFTHGSSSHQTAFRNHARGQRTTPAIGWGRWAIDVQSRNRYMNIIANVVGMSNWTSGTAMANGSCSPNEPVAIRFGCDGEPGGYTDSGLRATTIVHGNYDFITDGVAAWDGGADHAFEPSLYYSSKPAFFGGCAWPPFGPDVSPVVGTLPAKSRYEGSSACSGTTTPAPAAPTNLRILAN